MNRKINYYYGFLAALVMIQMLLTVFNLGQNIAYGQKISHLEKTKNNLIQEKIQNKKELSNRIAIRVLDQENQDFHNISDVVVIEANNDSLALK